MDWNKKGDKCVTRKGKEAGSQRIIREEIRDSNTETAWRTLKRQKEEGRQKGSIHKVKGELIDTKDNFEPFLLVVWIPVTQLDKHKWKHASTPS